MKFFINTVLGLLMLSSGVTMASTPTITSLDQLLNLDQTQLDSLYAGSEPGVIPRGDSHGKAMFFPGSLIGKPVADLAGLFWQGKVFDLSGKTLVNKVLGFEAIKAQVFYGTSLFDEKEAIIIDYGETSLIAGPVRDEIRQIAPGIYLGRAYVRTWIGPFLGVNFALDFRQSAEE